MNRTPLCHPPKSHFGVKQVFGLFRVMVDPTIGYKPDPDPILKEKNVFVYNHREKLDSDPSFKEPKSGSD